MLCSCVLVEPVQTCRRAAHRAFCVHSFCWLVTFAATTFKVFRSACNTELEHLAVSYFPLFISVFERASFSLYFTFLSFSLSFLIFLFFLFFTSFLNTMLSHSLCYQAEEEDDLSDKSESNTPVHWSHLIINDRFLSCDSLFHKTLLIITWAQ